MAATADDDEITIPPYPPSLQKRGKQLWDEIHTSADFSEIPETRLIVEEACYLSDEIARQRRLIKSAGRSTRVHGSNGQPVSMPEIADLQRNQGILLQLLKSVRLPDDEPTGGKMTRQQSAKAAADARWHG